MISINEASFSAKKVTLVLGTNMSERGVNMRKQSRLYARFLPDRTTRPDTSAYKIGRGIWARLKMLPATSFMPRRVTREPSARIR